MIEMKLCQKDMETIAAMVVAGLSNQQKPSAEADELITMREAAQICGISPARLRKIKGRFPYEKVGNTKQGRIMFYCAGLINNYLKGEVAKNQ